MRGTAQAPIAIGRVVFGESDPSRALPPSILLTAIAIHLLAATIAWWPGNALRTEAPRPAPSPLQLDKLIEIEMPKPKPAPLPAVLPPPPPIVEKAKPVPMPAKGNAPLPRNAIVRKHAPAVHAEPATAAQVVTRDEAAAAPGDSTFDVVTGKSAEYAGGATTSAGKSKQAVKEVVLNYQQVLLQWIERHKRYPPDALRRRIEGRPLVEIRIDRSGRLLGYQLTKSSRNADLDEAAAAMVRRAEPFPPIPEDHLEGTFVFRFGIDFNVRRP